MLPENLAVTKHNALTQNSPLPAPLNSTSININSELLDRGVTVSREAISYIHEDSTVIEPKEPCCVDTKNDTRDTTKGRDKDRKLNILSEKVKGNKEKENEGKKKKKKKNKAGDELSSLFSSLS
jgi:hypothetical protein